MKSRLAFRMSGAGIALFALWLGGSEALGQYDPFAYPRPERTANQRAGRWDIYGLGQYVHPDDIVFENLMVPDPEGNLLIADAALELDDTGMGGLGVGYNLSEHFSLNLELMFGSADYRATWGDYYLDGEMWLSSGKFNVEYNLLKGRFTPFVTAGLGYYYLDTGIPSGPPGWYCWWDYWWGVYVCTGAAPTYDELDFSLNAAAGVRWDITEVVFLKVRGGATWIDTARDSDWPAFIEASLALGVKF